MANRHFWMVIANMCRFFCCHCLNYWPFYSQPKYILVNNDSSFDSYYCWSPWNLLENRVAQIPSNIHQRETTVKIALTFRSTRTLPLRVIVRNNRLDFSSPSFRAASAAPVSFPR